MNYGHPRGSLTRRSVVQAGVGLAAAAIAGRSWAGHRAAPARIAISLDLEMSRHYPTWDQTHWDYEKGNLDEPTKRYAVEAARRVKARGGLIHFFAVGRVLEQADVTWLETISREGHPVGNHTYDHINLKAARPDQLQFRYQRAPWLIEGRSIPDVIAQNIAMTTRALRQRVGITVNGFRTPGGFTDGLIDRPDLRRLLREQGFRWVSSLYPGHPIGESGRPVAPETIERLLQAARKAQPFVYPDGIVEVPMSPISDVSAFRTGRWSLEPMLDVTRAVVDDTIERGGVFDFLGHPSCLCVADPQFRIIDLILDRVAAAQDRARVVDLATIASELLIHPDNAPQDGRPEGRNK